MKRWSRDMYSNYSRIWSQARCPNSVASLRMSEWVEFNAPSDTIYRVVQKTDTQIYFGDNFGNSAPILTILSLLQAQIYGA